MEPSMEIGIEARRLAIEIIASLVHVKHTMAELILKPSGISPEMYNPLLHRRDTATGRHLTKRQLAPLLLDALIDNTEHSNIVRSIVEIGAHWSSFHLAENEYAARATVQKARELLGTIELMEAWEAKQRELARKEELARMEGERAELLQRHSTLLLMMFDDLAKSDDPQKRGYLLDIIGNSV
jgi:hypothetical protein